MFKSDFHCHSKPLSHDGKSTAMEIAEAAYEKGLDILCFTEHVDDCYDTKDPASPLKFFINQEEMNDTFAAIREKFSGKMEVRLGMELAAICQNVDIARKITGSQSFDFILGSIHNVRGEECFHTLKYGSIERARDLVRRYILEYIDMVSLDLCDVLAHVGYTHRYMHPQGYDIDLMDYSDLLRELFEKAVSLGKGIEVNTSGLRDSTHQTFPSLPVLKLYRECGGEIVTTGSDSHITDYVGYGISDAYEIMRAAGFGYVAAYKDRKPEFHKI